MPNKIIILIIKINLRNRLSQKVSFGINCNFDSVLLSSVQPWVLNDFISGKKISPNTSTIFPASISTAPLFEAAASGSRSVRLWRYFAVTGGD